MGAQVLPIERRGDFSAVDKLLLPGVGGFKDAMHHLEDIASVLVDEMQEKPTLGICLGMQILAKTGYEYGKTAGLGIINAEVKKLNVSGKVPHLGWAPLSIINRAPLFEGITTEDNFYFMHSYEVVNTEAVAYSRYCDHIFISAFRKGDIYGVQFHPEKSRDQGLKILANFLSL